MTTVIISVSIWILTIIIYVIFNLLNKNKKLENMVINQSDFISNMKANIKQFDELANKIDAQIWVQSDPEFLALFEKVKEIQSSLQTYVD
jgi:Sec-independent protein translocase protein TatA